jgi:spore coat polysaccharide biosynthesis protein SpsF (cytidylyltransferase family)
MELKKNKVLAIIQARFKSTRFPGKVLKKIGQKTILEILIKRLLKSQNISKIIVACSQNSQDKKIINICKKLKINYFSGSEKDVLSRFYYAAVRYKGINIARITADCPLIDPVIADEVITNFFLKNVDYACTGNFPDGLDFEIFKFSALKAAFFKSKVFFEREHVTTYIKKNKQFKKFYLMHPKDYSSIRLSVDEKEDLIVIEKVIKSFRNNLYFNFKNIIDLFNKHKNIFSHNSHIPINEGANLNSGQKMWKRANKVIPGGTMLFSKNPDLFLPKFWPAYLANLINAVFGI